MEDMQIELRQFCIAISLNIGGSPLEWAKMPFKRMLDWMEAIKRMPKGGRRSG